MVIDSAIWAKDFSSRSSLINPYKVLSIKRHVRSSYKRAKRSAIDLTKNATATMIIMPIMIVGVVYYIVKG